MVKLLSECLLSKSKNNVGNLKQNLRNNEFSLDGEIIRKTLPFIESDKMKDFIFTDKKFTKALLFELTSKKELYKELISLINYAKLNGYREFNKTVIEFLLENGSLYSVNFNGQNIIEFPAFSNSDNDCPQPDNITYDEYLNNKTFDNIIYGDYSNNNTDNTDNIIKYESNEEKSNEEKSNEDNLFESYKYCRENMALDLIFGENPNIDIVLKLLRESFISYDIKYETQYINIYNKLLEKLKEIDMNLINENEPFISKNTSDDYRINAIKLLELYREKCN